MNSHLKKQILNKNPTLVDSLKNQHKELLVLFVSITEHAKDKNLIELNQLLNEFHSLVKDHIKLERELYMYLELIVSNSDGRYYNTRAEMRDIALLIKSKLNLHFNTPINNKTLKIFKHNFAILGKALLRRMRHEEKHLFKDYETHVE